MADANFVLSRGFTAEAAVTKNRAVKAGTAAVTVIPVAAEGDEVLGVAQFDVTAAEILLGKDVTVQMMGIVEMEASEAITVGDTVAISADGRGALANAGARNIGVCVGNPATAAGHVISVLLWLPGVVG